MKNLPRHWSPLSEPCCRLKYNPLQRNADAEAHVKFRGVSQITMTPALLWDQDLSAARDSGNLGGGIKLY
jgi:hypothetical protein